MLVFRAHAIAQRHSVRGTEKETLTELDPLVLPEEMAELNKAKKNLPLVLLVHLGIEIAKVTLPLACCLRVMVLTAV